eukprot:Hpha_TRINITY_DN3575_c0_g1::TRINITY_DN3575_c0_g1_i1::g.25758::m.25758
MAQGDKVTRATPVDSDKLWRDRVANELLAQKSWEQNYGFMRTTKGEGDESSPKATQQPRLDDGVDYTKLAYRAMKTESQSTMKHRKNIESVVMGATVHARKPADYRGKSGAPATLLPR